MDALANDLGNEAFFEGFSTSELELLASNATHVETQAGNNIIEWGKPAMGFHLIVTGRVALELPTPAGPLVVQTLGTGDILGLSWLVPANAWQFTARAVTDTTSIRFDSDAVREFAEHDLAFHNELVSRFLAVMMKRLQSTRVQLLDLYQGVGR